ncbi:MAG TPA: KR domain-containing protein, partial [Candidatus Thermoplasmatota archaeon]|nr:KR domain-containing protein [Candidatus Thermoplasmatota archaeon]
AQVCRARFGRVDLVLHAAGVEESRRIEDKDAAAWTRTLAPKVDGALHLLVACPEAKTFVLFGSVAGRFGNQAQADYSAANDALAKLAWLERSRGRDVRVLEWGPWGETGMATRGSTLKVLAAVGVEPIPTEAGVEAFLAEFAGPGRAEVVLAGALGALEAAAPSGPSPVPQVAQPPTLTLDPAKDAWLLDHAVEGVPYLPGVYGVALFEDACDGAPLEDVRFEYPVKFLRGRARTMRVERDGAALSLATEGTGARVHFRARVAARSAGAPQPARAPQVHGAVDASAIYARFFHGPAFRVLASARVGPAGVVARGGAPSPSAARNLDVEAGLQAAGLHALATAGVMALPHGVARLERFARAAPGALELRAALRGAKDGVWTYDVEAIADGRLAYRLSGLSLIAIGEGPTLAADPVAVAWRSVAGRDVAEVAVGADVDDVLPLLHAEEAAAARLHAHDKRRREWVAATLAAKAALRRAAGLVPWARLRVLNHPDGFRTVEGSPLAVSVGHAAGVAVAVAFDPACESAGVDVEGVERRGASWREEAFAPAERHALKTPEDETRAWAAKEALLKAIRRGLAEDLHAVRVTLAPLGAPSGSSSNGVGYDASGAVKERIASLGPRATRAEAVLADGRAYAVCVLEAP